MGELLVDMIPCEEAQLWLKPKCFECHLGGAPANVAVNLSRLGTPVTMFSGVGDDYFGSFLLSELQSYCVDTDFIQSFKGIRTTLAFMNFDKSFQPSFLFYRNPGSDMIFYMNEEIGLALKRARILHVGTFSLSSEPFKSAQLEAIKIAENNDSIISADLNLRRSIWDSDDKIKESSFQLIEMADIVKMNWQEFAFLSGTKNLIKGSGEIQRKPEQLFVVTLRSHGCFFRFNGIVGFVPPIYINFKNGVGTGDGFMAGLLHFLYSYILDRKSFLDLERHDLFKIFRYANACGALVATSVGAIPNKFDNPEISKYINKKHKNVKHTPEWLVLFDIDGTLIGNIELSKAANIYAVEKVTNSNLSTDGYSFAGKTDPQNLIALARLAGVDGDDLIDILPKIKKLYIDRTLDLFSSLGKIDVLCCVQDMLQYLSSRDDILLGILTGNLLETAQIKLEEAGLKKYFKFGVYGSDHNDRYQLPRIARKRAEKLFNLKFPPDRMIIVGDTIHDIGCASEYGAVSVAVATGAHTYDDLQEAKPNILLSNLGDMSAFLDVFH